MTIHEFTRTNPTELLVRQQLLQTPLDIAVDLPLSSMGFTTNTKMKRQKWHQLNYIAQCLADFSTREESPLCWSGLLRVVKRKQCQQGLQEPAN